MQKKTKCRCAQKDLSRISSLLKTIAENNRLKIICLLKKEELCVCKIIGALDIPHNLVSHHLKVLTKISILLKRKQGRFIFYRINQKALQGFNKEFSALIGKC